MVDNELDAVKMFIEDHINKYVGDRFDQTKWRWDNTFNIYVDNVMKSHQKVFENMYLKFTGRHALPGAKPFMMLDEFDDFVSRSGLINDCLA